MVWVKREAPKLSKDFELDYQFLGNCNDFVSIILVQEQNISNFDISMLIYFIKVKGEKRTCPKAQSVRPGGSFLLKKNLRRYN